MKEFKYLAVLFTTEASMERETGWRNGAVGAVLSSFYHTVVTKRELSQKAKLSIYQAVSFLPLPTVMEGGS